MSLLRGASLSLFALTSACASTPAPAAKPHVKQQPVEPHEPEGPAPLVTWKDALERFSSTCPVPFFTIAQPEILQVGARTFTLAGSVLTLQGGPWKGPLKIGVLGAIKDADEETRQNLKKAAAAFKKAGVVVVVANGDLVGNETAALVPVVQMLGEELDVPVLAHSGNYLAGARSTGVDAGCLE